MNQGLPQDATTRKLRLLIVDDSEDDVFLIIYNLHQGSVNFEFTHVEKREELSRALQDGEWDVVITDHNMIGFTSQDALAIVRAVSPDLPVIVVSGDIHEDVAIGAMHLGAQDYVMKDNLARLVPVVLREARQHESRKVHQQMEESYRFLRYHDNLTNLVNRQEFENRINQTLEQARQDRETHVLMFLDLDQFKVVNETCGHTAGDELLVKITKTLKTFMRERDTLARLGGDEFGILLNGCNKPAALSLAQQIKEGIRESRFVWQGKTFEITVSIGVVEINEHVSDSHELLSCADIACYAAKDRGRDTVVWFSPDDEEYNKRKSDMQWAPRIREAIAQNRFVLFHQPMAPLGRHQGLHTEFLLRLRGDDQGLIPPGVFMPAAERYNLMPLIDRWVVRQVFDYLHRTGRGGAHEGTYFINLSGTTLSDRSFFDDVRQLQARLGIRPERICFEITETAAIDNLYDTVEFINEIRQIGFKFALDDFGVGLSSFTYLKTLPADYLKIDGSFVLNMLQNTIDRGIVESCNTIAHAAGLTTIAEFVENDAITVALKQIGVDFAQGYGIAKPGPLSDV